MDLNSAHRVCRIGPTVLYDAHNRNITVQIECAVVYTCAADKARKQLPTISLAYYSAERNKNETSQFQNYKILRLSVFDVCTLSALWWDSEVPKKNKQYSTLCQVKCKVVLALNKPSRHMHASLEVHVHTVKLSSTWMCKIHATIGLT